ncbi:MAG: ipoprotein LpqH [Mycobacterium sp.]|nr:ipoprotein LpqH [Mycobacterium sp.]
MQNRFVVIVGAVSCALGLVSCSSGPANSPQPKGSLPIVTAEVIVNGQPAGTTHEIKCSQDGWNHTFETGNKDSGVTMVVDTEKAPIARSVTLNNIGGFTGTAWQYQQADNSWTNQMGESTATVIGTTFKVSGTAKGADTADPNKGTDATFEVRVNC